MPGKPACCLALAMADGVKTIQQQLDALEADKTAQQRQIDAQQERQDKQDERHDAQQRRQDKQPAAD